MIDESLSRKRPALAAGALLALGSLLAGCMGTEESGGPGDLDNQDDDAKWEARLTFTNATAAAWLNLTVSDTAGNTLTNFTVKLLDPDGNEAASVDVDFADGTGAFNATWGDAAPRASTHLEAKEGRWTYQVWAADRVSVETDFNAVDAAAPAA